MPELVFKTASKSCTPNSKIGLLATETTVKSNIYSNFFKKKFKLVTPPQKIQTKNVNNYKSVKMGRTKEWKNSQTSY